MLLYWALSRYVKWCQVVVDCGTRKKGFYAKTEDASIGDSSALLCWLQCETCLQGSPCVFEVPFMENLSEFLQQAWYKKIRKFYVHNSEFLVCFDFFSLLVIFKISLRILYLK